MSPDIHLPSPWKEFLLEVDTSLSTATEIHCLGGFVLTVVHGIPRTTSDLDYIAAIPNSVYVELESLAGRESKLAKKHRVYLQHLGAIPDLPEDYERRLTFVDFGLSRLRLMVLDPYDLVLSKLTRNSPKDREDVKAIAGKLQLSIRELMSIFDREMKSWLPNRDRHELTLRLWREYFLD